MAYNNYFPMGYGYPSNMIQNQQAQTQQQNFNTGNIIWVQGEAGAKSYLVAPNTTVQLWDSEEQVIYLKSADASGMPSMKILDYSIRTNTQPTTAQNLAQTDERYVTKEEFKAMQESFEKRLKSIGGMKDE